jgi:hypothetical protein
MYEIRIVFCLDSMYKSHDTKNGSIYREAIQVTSHTCQENALLVSDPVLIALDCVCLRPMNFDENCKEGKTPLCNTNPQIPTKII